VSSEHENLSHIPAVYQSNPKCEKNRHAESLRIYFQNPSTDDSFIDEHFINYMLNSRACFLCFSSWSQHWGVFYLFFGPRSIFPVLFEFSFPSGETHAKCETRNALIFASIFAPFAFIWPFQLQFSLFHSFFLHLSQNFSLFSHSSSHIFPPEWHRLIFIFPKGGVFSIMYTPELAFTAHVRKICMCITLWLIQINMGKKLLEWNFSWCCV
jgi:hypothetical protein